MLVIIMAYIRLLPTDEILTPSLSELRLIPNKVRDFYTFFEIYPKNGSSPIPRQVTFLILKILDPRHSQKRRGTGIFKIRNVAGESTHFIQVPRHFLERRGSGIKSVLSPPLSLF